MSKQMNQPDKTEQTGHSEIADIEAAKKFLKKNGRHISLIILLIIVVVLIATRGVQQRRSHRQEAMLLLGDADTAENLQLVIDEYPDTPAAVAARLEIAFKHFSLGNYEKALEAYRVFREKHPDHHLASSVVFSEALCLEALERHDEALQKIDDFLAAHENHFLVPLAILARSRNLELSGRIEEGRAVYKEFLAAYEDEQWIMETVDSEQRMQYLLYAVLPHLPQPEMLQPVQPFDDPLGEGELPPVDYEIPEESPEEPGLTIEPETEEETEEAAAEEEEPLPESVDEQ